MRNFPLLQVSVDFSYLFHPFTVLHLAENNAWVQIQIIIRAQIYQVDQFAAHDLDAVGNHRILLFVEFELIDWIVLCFVYFWQIDLYLLNLTHIKIYY